MRQDCRLHALLFVITLSLVLVSCVGNPHFVGGKNYVKQEVWDKAVMELQLATQEQPENAEAWYYLGWAEGEMGDYDKAAVALLKCKEISDSYDAQADRKINEFWDDLAARGQDLEKGGQYDEAAVKFESALHLKPDHVIGNIFIAGLYSQMGEVEKAAEKYETALEVDPDNEAALTNYATLLEENGLDERAIPLFERLVESTEGDKENLLHYLANMYGRVGQPEKQLALYRRLGDAEPLMQQAYEAFTGEDFAQSLGLYQKAMEIAEPGSVIYLDASYNAMVSAYKIKDFNRAISIGEKLVEEKPDDPVYWRLLGNSYARAKRGEDSLRALKQAQDLETGK